MPPRSPFGIGTRSTRQHIASTMSPNLRPGDPVLARNRQASHEYHLLEFLEAGIQLTGTEVKALRAGLAHLREGYVRVENGEAWLIQVHIGQYEMGNRQNHEPERRRRLLLHRREIEYLDGRALASFFVRRACDKLEYK